MADARRRNGGEGQIRLRSDGRYEGRMRLGVDADGRAVRKCVYGASKADVLDKLALLRLGHDATPRRQGTIAELLERWLVERIQPRRRAKTFSQYDGIARRWIVPFVGDHRVERFGVREVERLYAAIQKPRKYTDKVLPGATPRTQLLVHVVLHAAFKQAIRWQMIERNPCDDTDAPQYTAQKRVPLTAEQARALLSAARGHRLYGTILLPLATGLRPGEVFGLLWEHVDLKRRLLHVEHSLEEILTPILSDTKNPQSKRPVVLPPIAVEAIEERRRLRIAEGNAASPYVFCDNDGGPLRKSNFLRDVWRPILQSAGLESERKVMPARRGRAAGPVPKREKAAGATKRGFPYKDLRHTWATLQRSHGTDIHTLKEALGHTSILLTSNVYTGRAEPQHIAAAERTQAFLAEVAK